MATQPTITDAVQETLATSATVSAPAPSITTSGAGGIKQSSVVTAAPGPKLKAGERHADSQAKSKRKVKQPDRFDQIAARLRTWWREVPSWLASLVVHAVALVALGLFYIEPQKKSADLAIVASPQVTEESLHDLDSPVTAADVTTLDSSLSTVESGPLEDVPLNPLANDTDAAPTSLDLASLNDSLVRQEDLLKTTGVTGASGQGVGGRSGALKGELLKKGGSDASEAAVARALKWLSNHQLPDGGWNFDLEKCPTCHGLCKDSGEGNDARLGATAMALLPFLGAGQTHREGQYKEVVRKGLYYLTTHTDNTGGFLSMHEPRGTMYSHGLGTIALCEAYAMTNDRTLMPYAQGAVNFIAYAQDPVGGGWRYRPRVEAGDTSVVGWQIMALKSAQMAGLEVPNSVLNRAVKFLDSVQSDDGAIYGYTAPSDGFRRGTSSVGLLCRMYLGWKKDNPGLKKGVSLISREGPSMPRRTDNRADMYYNYYATQVLRHWGGHEFDQWNGKVRDWLVESQAREGHETGSWFFSFDFHSVGGRLYCTSMATMMLEVYYRHLPLYGGKAVDDEFSR
jgi:hypothetical protein